MVAGEPLTQRSQMLKGLIDPCLLAVIEADDAYGYEIVRRLEIAGLGDVATGSVYPALARLEQAGLLQSRREESGTGPPRKYYSTTVLGRAHLEAWRQEWLRLTSSVTRVLTNVPPQHQAEEQT